MAQQNIPQKRNGADKLAQTKNYIAPPMEESSVRTTLYIKNSNLQALTRIGSGKNLTFTAMANEAMKDYCAKMNNVQQIDTMIRETNGFWYRRDLAQVVKLLPVEVAKAMIPYQIAYLYCNLKDTADKEQVFQVLKLVNELKQINALNGVLQKASEFEGERLIGYNIYQLAIDITAKLTLLQHEYLTLKLGSDSMKQLEERNPSIFPEVALQVELSDESDKEESAIDEAEQELVGAESVPIS